MSKQTRELVQEVLLKKLKQIKSLRVYHSEKNTSTIVHIIIRDNCTGFKRNYFKGANKKNGGTKILTTCEVPYPWSYILSHIDKNIEELFDKSPDVIAEGCQSASEYFLKWKQSERKKKKDMFD